MSKFRSQGFLGVELITDAVFGNMFMLPMTTI